MEQNNNGLAPTIASFRLRWWTPRGATYLAVRTGWRYFVTGREIRGNGDNATFWHDATRDHRGNPVEKLSRARWRRVARRWVIAGVPAIMAGIDGAAGVTSAGWQALGQTPPAWAQLPYGTALLAYVCVVAGVSATVAAPIVAAWWRTRHIRSTYVYPAAAILAKVTGVKVGKRDALSMIELPSNFGEPSDSEPEPIRVYVPDGIVLDTASKKRIADAVGSRLGAPEPVARWTESGVVRRYVELLPQSVPDSIPSIEHLMPELLETTMGNPMVGVMKGRRISRIDMHNDSPHTLGSAGSGAGKSTLYKLIAMQRLRLGAYAVILDFKKWSHLRWAGRLPAGRVAMEDTVAGIHDMLIKVLDELIWRKSFNLDQEDELAALPVLDVYVEEINTLMALLVSYWQSERARIRQEARTALRRIKETAKRSGDPDWYAAEIEEAEDELARANGLPVTSPAVQAIRFGVNLGREFKVHFHFIGQSVSAQAAGGRDTRESFQTRLLARWNEKTWKMLADGIPFVSCPSGDVGIWAHVHQGTYEIVRVPYVPDEFAVRYVLAGERPSMPMFHGDVRPSMDASSHPSIASTEPLSKILDVLPAKKDGSRITLKALRLASGRDGFPVPTNTVTAGHAALYDVDEVLAWFRSREGLTA